LSQKKKRGPPATGKGILIGVRLQPPELSNVDAWIATLDDVPSRPEAIRRLIELGLAAPQKRRGSEQTGSAGRRLVEHALAGQPAGSTNAEGSARTKRRAKASEMAGHEID